MSESRIIDLESKISHQEFVIENLQKQLQEQGMAIFQFETRVATVEKQLREILASMAERGPANQKPPHY